MDALVTEVYSQAEGLWIREGTSTEVRVVKLNPKMIKDKGLVDKSMNELFKEFVALKGVRCFINTECPICSKSLDGWTPKAVSIAIETLNVVHHKVPN